MQLFFHLQNECSANDTICNLGVCVPNYNTDSYTCHCPSTYTGANCETSTTTAAQTTTAAAPTTTTAAPTTTLPAISDAGNLFHKCIFFLDLPGGPIN